MLPERFWNKVQKTSKCWLWTAATNAQGYGLFNIGKRPNGTKISALAHRVAYADKHGECPEQLDHKCNVHNCVRPSHLQPLDISAHGRKSAGARYGKAAMDQWDQGKCYKGHTKVLRHFPSGDKWVCLPCRAAAVQRGYYRRRRAS